MRKLIEFLMYIVTLILTPFADQVEEMMEDE